MYVVSEKVLQIDYLTGRTIAQKAEVVDRDFVVSNSPGKVEATKPMHFSKTYSSSSTLTVGIANQIRILVS
jgi:hypothetical protein